jgi:hypothetical protein
MLEKTHTEFKKEVLNQTRAHPLDARKMLLGGPDDAGSMPLVVSGEEPPVIPLMPELRKALESVLRLGEHHPKLRIQNDGRLAMETPSQDVMLLYPHELRVIAAAIGKEVPNGE